MALCRQVIEEHVHSVVKIGCNKKNKKHGSQGTGFIVHMGPNFCLVMTCGHVLKDHIEGTVYVSFGDTKIDARVVFADYVKEVSMVRIDRSTEPQMFATVAGYTAVRWSAQEAQKNTLVAILSRVTDVKRHLCPDPSVFHGTVSVPPRFEPKKSNKKVLLHLGTADYTSVKGNSGSAIFNKDKELQVVGIHISAHDLMARFVCLQGVKLVMEEYLKKEKQAVSVAPGHSVSVAYLLEKIVNMENVGPSSAGVGAGAGESSSEAGPSSSAGAGAPQ